MQPRFRHSLVLLTLGALGCGDSAPNGAASKSTSPPAPIVQGSGVQAVSDNAAPQEPSDGLVDDDGRTLWASPTSGEPIDLSLVPAESGLFLYARPQALLATAEGCRVWRALLLDDAALESAQVVTVGVATGEDYESVSQTVAVDPPASSDSASSDSASDDLPLVPREFEQLIDTTDSDRHVTLVCLPRFLVGDGGALLSGPWAPLRELVLAQGRDEWAAVALSLHIDDLQRLYWELRIVPNAAEPEVRVAAGVVKQSQGWDDDLAAVVRGRDWSAYSRRVVERSPRMLAVVGKYARRGVDGRQAVINGYVPSGTAHQLALAAERIVAELASPVVAEPMISAAPSLAELPIAERLQTPVTIQFTRESLETAVAILAETIATPIEIRGRDLQLEGITRNQMLALDVTDLPAEAALLEVLRRANPDKETSDAADPRQKLVYVVGDGGVTITTRAAAEGRGDTLPTVFQAN